MFTVSSGGSGMEAATPVAGPAAPVAVAGPSSVAAYVASRWDATPVVGVPSSADAAKNASKAHGATRNRWDETPATEGPSSRWDAATPQLGKQGQAEPGTASKKRSRWDETPVAGGPAGGSLVAARYDTMNPCCEFILVCVVGAMSATPAATPLGNLVLSMATPAMSVGQTPEMMQQVPRHIERLSSAEGSFI